MNTYEQIKNSTVVDTPLTGATFKVSAISDDVLANSVAVRCLGDKVNKEGGTYSFYRYCSPSETIYYALVSVDNL